MHIRKSITRDMNQKRALFNNGIYKIYSFCIDMISNTINGNIRSYADVEAYNYQDGMTEGKAIEELSFSISKSSLEYDETITNPDEQIEKAIYQWLLVNDQRYIGGTLIETEVVNSTEQ